MIEPITHNPSDAAPSWLKRIAQNQTWVTAIGASLLLVVVYAAGILAPLDQVVTDFRFNLLEKPASGDIVIVELDQKSRAELGETQATRKQHADVINNLISAGAERVGMKFDFHAEKNELSDTALLMAAHHADGRLVLPVSTTPVAGFNSEVIFRQPFDDLAKTANLGSIQLEQSSDGHIHDYRLIHAWRDSFIPSFAGEMVKNTSTDHASLIIDYGIDAKSIPRISYMDVLNNTFSRKDIEGKFVFVGTTEGVPGETLSVPIYGTLSGIELHALAGEMILQGDFLESLPSPTDLALAMCILIVLIKVLLSLSSITGAMVTVISAVVLLVVSVAVQSVYAISIPITASLFSIILAYGVATLSRRNSKSQDLIKSGFEARERSELMGAIISTNFDSIVVCDEQDRVYFINPMAANMLNWTVEGALGRERDSVFRLPEELSVTGNDTHVLETVITRADGNELDVEMAVTETVLTPSKTRFERRKKARQYRIYTFRDISERKKAAESMAEAADRAMQADRLKSEFIANMSHELRAPLNSIIGFSEVIKQELFGNLGNPHYKEYAEDIFVSGTHLMSIIDDLLEVSRIASGKIELTDTEIDMERMFAECLQVVRNYPKASKKVLSASMRPGCPDLIADKRAIKQILINLLSNAVKFTHEGGGIRLSAAPSSEGGVEIMVSDDGIGIPPDEMGRITDAFHQIDHADHRKNAGTGLGLHIVQSLAQLHDAEISVTSTVNSGTQVRVVFPPERNGTAPNVIQLEMGKNTG